MCVGGYRLTDFAHVKTHRGMSEESFLCLKSYGNTIVMNFFKHIFFLFHLQIRSYLAVNIKNVYGMIKDLSISFFGNKRIFVCQNLYGHTLG